MVELNASRLLKADQRALDETSVHKRYCTFNYERFYEDHKSAFGKLIFVNDETILSGGTINVNSDDEMLVLLLPLDGALCFRDDKGNKQTIIPEEFKIVKCLKDHGYSIENDSNHSVNYLRIGLKLENNLDDICNNIFPIHFKKPNILEDLALGKITDSVAEAFLGIFTSRSEGIYTLKHSNNGLFIYVVNGAFEAEGRLLEHRDGLCVWDTDIFEFEALAEGSIIMILEFPL